MKRKPFGIWALIIYFLLSAAALYWMANSGGPAALVRAITIGLTSDLLSAILQRGLAERIAWLYYSNHSLLVQAGLLVVLAVGIFLMKPWARVLSILYLTVTCLIQFGILFFAISAKLNPAVAVSGGMLFSLLFLGYLLLPRVKRLFAIAQDS